MIEIKTTLNLPRGYELHEDSEFIYLYKGTTLLNAFTQPADPLQIKETAWNHSCRDDVTKNSKIRYIENILAESALKNREKFIVSGYAYHEGTADALDHAVDMMRNLRRGLTKDPEEGAE